MNSVDVSLTAREVAKMDLRASNAARKVAKRVVIINIIVKETIISASAQQIAHQKG